VESLGLRWFRTQDEIFADPSIDAVFIATTNTTHVPIGLAALAAGKHVIVEKPMSTNVSDAERLVAAAASGGLSLSINHMMQFNEFNVSAADIVRRGVLGLVSDAVFHMEFDLAIDPTASKLWRCTDAAELGGPIGDIASHCFYTMEFVLGSRITALAAVYYPKTSSSAVEDGAIIRVNLASGSVGTVRVSFVDARGGSRGIVQNMGYEVYGEKAVLRSYGTLSQVSGHPGEDVQIRLELDDFTKVTQIVPEHITNIYAAVVLRHAESIISGKRLDGEDGLHNVRLCVAAHESATSGGKLITID
jgi:predicted dehydrogenase